MSHTPGPLARGAAPRALALGATMRVALRDTWHRRAFGGRLDPSPPSRGPAYAFSWCRRLRRTDERRSPRRSVRTDRLDRGASACSRSSRGRMNWSAALCHRSERDRSSYRSRHQQQRRNSHHDQPWSAHHHPVGWAMSFSPPLKLFGLRCGLGGIESPAEYTFEVFLLIL